MEEHDTPRVRPIAAPYVVPGPTGVTVRDRLKDLTPADERVLRLVGTHLGSLASRDLATRCRDGHDHDAGTWAARKRELTKESSARWAGSVTKATHDQWALARRCQTAHIQRLESGVRTLRLRPDGEVSIRLPAPLAHLANAPRGRYVLACTVRFRHRWQEWADRVEASRAVAYRIHYDAERARWYISASWQRPKTRTLPLEAARAQGMVGVDTNADHLAAYRLDVHGNPVGNPERFFFDLSGAVSHRDAQARHALIRLLRWTQRTGAQAIGIEDLDFAREKTREKHGRRKQFRNLISGMPTGRLRARIVSMAAGLGIMIVAVDPAYTSKWGVAHWRTPLNSSKRTMTRHDAASVAIGRRALGHPIRRRTAPPRHHRSDGGGPLTVQADPDVLRREGLRRLVTERARDACGRTGTDHGTRGTSVSHTVGDARRAGMWVQGSLLDTVEERLVGNLRNEPALVK
ncbi:IS200/IS605 family accessory protein TnpB-related protein [Nocardiopsis aegyptia]|uniref:IS200/IS605 family accessory protein TnpB-related protein n=1 Tax=Nocardiopsis aegyptia TaxID=220378 RepID=UPI0036716F23